MKLVLLALFFSFAAKADSLYVKAGIDPLTPGLAQSRYYAAGLEHDLTPHVALKAELGGVYDKRSKAKNSALLSGAVGVKLDFYFVEVSYFFGPSWLDRPDGVQGSHVNFQQELRLLLKQDGYQIGLVGSHVSNAGLSARNEGRNYLLLQVSLPVKL
jgi:hypothetical protein